MKIKVRNQLRQPFTLDLDNLGYSKIFLSREVKELTEDELIHPETQSYIDKGILLVLEIQE